MMRVCRQPRLGKVDGSTIEELAAREDRHENRRVPVLDDADRRGRLRSSSGHVFLFGPTVPP